MALQDVLYYVKTTAARPTSGGTLLSEAALQRAVDKDDVQLQGGIGKRQATIWHLKASTVTEADITPKIGDVVEDADGVRWTATAVKLQTFKTRWRLECLKENN